MPDDTKDYLAIIANADRFKIFAAADETKECLAALEAQFTEKWATTDKPEVAQELWHRVRAVRQVRQVIQENIDAGKLADAEMKRDGEYQKRLAAEDAKPRKRRAN
ncbi:MAG: hypothetical protein R3F54_28745 [Alphaproteobacteria bacterium]